METSGTEHRPTLVLADDSAAILVACRRLLERRFDIRAAVSSGSAAIAAVGEHVPEVLVLDLSMPGMTGVQVIEELIRRNSRTRIVILTVHQDAVIADRVLERGAYGFVTKARMARDLVPAIQAAISGRRYRSRIAP